MSRASPSSHRSRTMTEKGLEYALLLKKEIKDSTINRLRKLMVDIDVLSHDKENYDVVKNNVGVVHSLMEMLTNAINRCCELTKDAEEEGVFQRTLSHMKADVQDFSKRTNWWLDSVKKEEAPKSITGSRVSSVSTRRSTTSRKSSRSSRSYKMMVDEKATLAALKTEADFMEQKIEAESLLTSAKTKMERLRIQEEMAKTKARLTVYESEEDEKTAFSRSSERNRVVIKDEVDSNSKCTEWLEEACVEKRMFKNHQVDRKTVLHDKEAFIPAAKPCHTDKLLKDGVSKPSEEAKYVPKRPVKVSPMDGRSSKDVTYMPYDVTYMPYAPSQEADVTTRLLCQILQQQSAPDIDIDCFSGDPLEFKYFMSTFEEVLERRIRDPRGRLTRLLKYTQGEAKELIKPCIQKEAEQGYSMAKSLLTKRFGDPHRILSSYKKELQNWKQLKAGDASGYRKFYSFLLRCNSLVEGQYWNTLDSPDNLCTLVTKLPGQSRERWNRKAFALRNKWRREPQLDDFISFFDEETSLANDPLYSKEALQDFQHNISGAGADNIERTAGARHEKRKMHNAATKLSSCATCSSAHDLDSYPQFKEKELKEKRDIIFKKRLCFKCYGKDHIARDCKSPRTFNDYKGQHPTGLHGFIPKAKEDEVKENEDTMNNAFTKTSHDICRKNISMSVVPVIVKHPNSPKEHQTFALLDNCSQGTFMNESLMRRLGVHGAKTSITVNTLHGEVTEVAHVVTGLTVRAASFKDQPSVKLPKTFTRSKLPADAKDVPTAERIKPWPYLHTISEQLTKDRDVKVELLIGANCPASLEPKEIIKSRNNGPYACKTTLGWCVIGPISSSTRTKVLSCNSVVIQETRDGNNKQVFVKGDQFEEVDTKNMIKLMYENEFTEPKLSNNTSKKENEKCESIEDKRFVKIMDDGAKLKEGHYVLLLPFRDKNPHLPNNRVVAERRSLHLKGKLLNNPQFHKDYTSFMNEIIKKGYARKSTANYPDGNVWYIPHHGVYHPNKPGKIRVVFDCSSEYKNRSINKELMQGPYLTNHLVEILTRFRMEPIAVMADVEKMFYQVQIPDHQRGFMKFLWWENGDCSGPIGEYEMCVHTFGGSFSPSCSNYALRKTGKDNRFEFGEEAFLTILKNFYADDMLKSVETEEKAIELIHKVKGMCAAGGFNLTKFVSNSVAVLESLPDDERRKGVKSLEFCMGSMPIEKALGVTWEIKNDFLGFHIVLKDCPLTRRGALATISSIYDPLGLAAPFLFAGRKLLQQLCADKLDWDDDIPDDVKVQWLKWREKLTNLENIHVPRCFKPVNFGEIKEATLHHFSDASSKGYGQCSYLRLKNNDDQVHCSLVIGKSRVCPLKEISIPRLELTAATLSVKIGLMIEDALEYSSLKQYHWTDSKVFLGYIQNDTKRFKVFVANRVAQIRDHSEASKWRYICSKQNPADTASRGIDPSKFIKSLWFSGPDFLWDAKVNMDHPERFHVDENDVELRRNVSVFSTEISSKMEIFERFSNWMKLKEVITYVLMFIAKTKIKRRNRHQMSLRSNVLSPPEISVSDLAITEYKIVSMVQRFYFSKELLMLQNNESVNDSSRLSRLDAFIDENGIIRVGGRLRKATLPYKEKHPIVLPKEAFVSKLVVRWCHEKTNHSGRTTTMNEVRTNGYWIVNLNSVVRKLIWSCVSCRKLRSQCGSQKMADLPVDRMLTDPPFSYCGLDLFGPFKIKERRSLVKRYGLIFTCLSCRGVHLETTNSLDTDSFILALRRFIARRGNVRMIRSDNVTNIIGAKNELSREFVKMDQKKVKRFLLDNNTDWIEWKTNPP